MDSGKGHVFSDRASFTFDLRFLEPASLRKPRHSMANTQYNAVSSPKGQTAFGALSAYFIIVMCTALDLSAGDVVKNGPLLPTAATFRDAISV